ncbi:hypothetical protein Tco_0258384 [Tanacetum coccineum]
MGVLHDLYNNLKVYENEIKGQSSSSSNSHNVAFVSLEKTSSTNEAINTAHEVSTASSHGQASSFVIFSILKGSTPYDPAADPALRIRPDGPYVTARDAATTSAKDDGDDVAAPRDPHHSDPR